MAYDDDPLRLDNAPVASKQPKTVLRRQQQRAFSAKVGSTLARWQTAVTNEIRREANNNQHPNGTGFRRAPRIAFEWYIHQ